MPSPRRVDASSQVPQLDRRSPPPGYVSAIEADEQRPTRNLYAAPSNDQEYTSNRTRLVYRDEHPPYEPSHHSMFSRLHTREPIARPRMQSQNAVIELTSSPQRPSDDGRPKRFAPAHSYATTSLNQRPRMPDTLPNQRPRTPVFHREYDLRGSEHPPPVEYATRPRYTEPERVYSRASAADEARYTGSVPQHGRRNMH